MKSILFALILGLASFSHADDAPASSSHLVKRYTYINAFVTNLNLDLRSYLQMYGPEFSGVEVQSVQIGSQSQINGSYILYSGASIIGQTNFLAPDILFNLDIPVTLNRDADTLVLGVRGQVYITYVQVVYRVYDNGNTAPTPPPAPGPAPTEPQTVTVDVHTNYIGKTQIDIGSLIDLSTLQDDQLIAVSLYGKSMGASASYVQVIVDGASYAEAYVAYDGTPTVLNLKNTFMLGKNSPSLALKLSGDTTIDKIELKVIKK